MTKYTSATDALSQADINCSSHTHTHNTHQLVSCVFVFATSACVSLHLMQVPVYLCDRGSGWMNHTQSPCYKCLCVFVPATCACVSVPAASACVSLFLLQVPLSLLQVPVRPCYKCLCIFVPATSALVPATSACVFL